MLSQCWYPQFISFSSLFYSLPSKISWCYSLPFRISWCYYLPCAISLLFIVSPLSLHSSCLNHSIECLFSAIIRDTWSVMFNTSPRVDVFLSLIGCTFMIRHNSWVSSLSALTIVFPHPNLFPPSTVTTLFPDCYLLFKGISSISTITPLTHLSYWNFVSTIFVSCILMGFLLYAQ